MKNVLITGSSSGIGLATAVHLAKQGYSVYATLRNPSEAPNLKAAASSGLPITMVKLDVTNDQAVERGVADVLAKASQIDVLVNNAGINAGYAVELTSMETAHQVLETNFFGAARMMRAVLPGMRQRRAGTIINVTSMAGRVSAGCHGYYTASKFALEGLSECVQLEAKEYGIRVAVIEPGVILTSIFGKMTETPSEAEPYFTPYRRIMHFFEAQLSNPTMPDAVAKTIQQAIEAKSPKFRYPVGKDAPLLMEMRSKFGDEGYLMGPFIADDEQFYAGVESLTGVDLWHEPANGSVEPDRRVG